jgi:hypothetical protein
MIEQEGAIAAQRAHDPCTTHAAPDAGSPAFVDQFVAQQTAGQNAFFLETEARGTRGTAGAPQFFSGRQWIDKDEINTGA